MKKTALALTLILLFILSVDLAFAHGGGTDAYGCHVDHKTGIRHCH